MNGLLFAMLGVILAGLGARDQMMTATFAARQGQHLTLLLIAVATGLCTAALAAWAALAIAPMLVGKARLFFAAMALGLAGMESLFLSPGRKPIEPTHSLGAYAIVLLAQQITDAARFLVFAMAVLTGQAVNAGLGGAIGNAIMLGAAWSAPELFEWHRLRLLRRGLGALLVLTALVLAGRATGYL